MTKAAAIRELHALRALTRIEIAEQANCEVAYVDHVLWRQRHPVIRRARMVRRRVDNSLAAYRERDRLKAAFRHETGKALHDRL